MFSVISLLFVVSIAETAVPEPGRPESFELTGIVTDISKTPIPEAEISLVKPAGLERNARTGKNGRFVIRNLPAGAIALKIRRLGYEARTVEFTLDKNAGLVEVMLKPIPEELDAITVSEEEKQSLREYYEHKTQRGSFAKFFDGAAITKRGAANISDLFRNVPGVAINASAAAGGNTVRIRGCQPMLWVDGQRIPRAEVDEVVSPRDVAGLEFYPSMAGIPAQYMDRSTRACGSIIVWTKNQ